MALLSSPKNPKGTPFTDIGCQFALARQKARRFLRETFCSIRAVFSGPRISPALQVDRYPPPSSCPTSMAAARIEPKVCPTRAQSKARRAHCSSPEGPRDRSESLLCAPDAKHLNIGARNVQDCHRLNHRQAGWIVCPDAPVARGDDA